MVPTPRAQNWPICVRAAMLVEQTLRRTKSAICMSRARLSAWPAFTLRSRASSYFIDGPCRPRVVTGLSMTLRFQPPATGAPGLARCSPVPGTGDALRLSTSAVTAAKQAPAAHRRIVASATQVPLATGQVPLFYIRKSFITWSPLTESNRRPSPCHEPPPCSVAARRTADQAEHEPTSALASPRQALASVIRHSICHSV
jgi:hypothetical protein